jgi:hypothetical protein
MDEPRHATDAPFQLSEAERFAEPLSPVRAAVDHPR